MIDKIYFKNPTEMIIVFTDRNSVTIYSSDGNALELTQELLNALNNNTSVSDEDTLKINVDF